jgi:hypothetical protein
MIDVYLPDPLYKAKPYALIGVGASVIISIGNPLAFVGGGIMIGVGAMILRMRNR